MLEVILLKTTHTGLHEARKLLPYLKNADVYAPENASASEETSLEEESIWEEQLAKKQSLNEFRKFIDTTTLGFSPETTQYCKIQRDYMFINKVKVWHVERLNQEEKEKLSELEEERKASFENGLIKLAEGNVWRYLELARKSRELDMEATKMRDKHIAKQIESAESSIREKYQDLRQKEKITFTINLGALHNPEAFTSFPIRCIDLKRSIQSPSDLLDFQYYRATTSREIDVTILKNGAVNMVKAGRLKVDNVFTMDYDQLISALRKFPY